MRQSADDLAKMLTAHKYDASVQVRQLAHRLKLIEHWEISPGDRILEIGCGQGDMTVALADAVGEEGHVVALDTGSLDYGAPVTLGQSIRQIKEGPLGGRIDFHVQAELPPFTSLGTFDAVVLAHSPWYFESPASLTATLNKAHEVSSRLLLAEWHLIPDEVAQVPHLLGVLLQNNLQKYLPITNGNIRSLLDEETIVGCLTRANWVVESAALIDSSSLDDGRWEVDACLMNRETVREQQLVPENERLQIDLNTRLLQRMALGPVRSLPTLCIEALAGNGGGAKC